MRPLMILLTSLKEIGKTPAAVQTCSAWKRFLQNHAWDLNAHFSDQLSSTLSWLNFDQRQWWEFLHYALISACATLAQLLLSFNQRWQKLSRNQHLTAEIDAACINDPSSKFFILFSRVYIPCIYLLNKIDQISIEVSAHCVSLLDS